MPDGTVLGGKNLTVINSATTYLASNFHARIKREYRFLVPNTTSISTEWSIAQNSWCMCLLCASWHWSMVLNWCYLKGRKQTDLESHEVISILNFPTKLLDLDSTLSTNVSRMKAGLYWVTCKRWKPIHRIMRRLCLVIPSGITNTPSSTCRIYLRIIAKLARCRNRNGKLLVSIQISIENCIFW